VGLLLALVLGAVVVWLVREYESSLAFFPSRGEDATPASYGIPYTRLTVTTADGERLRVWHLPRPDAQAQVIYFHGNGGNLSLWGDALAAISHERFEVIAVDYRGYGMSTGQPSERGLYRDVDATLALVHDRLRRNDLPLVYWGRSLGTTMAAYGASVRAPDGVVLESGWPTLRAVLASNPVLWVLSWASSYRFPTAELMSGVRAPALVLHGDADSIIPYRLGQRLYEVIPGPKRFVTIKGADHNDTLPRSPDPYWSAVHEFVESLIPSRK